MVDESKPQTYPQTEGEYTIIGPDCMKLGNVINYEGVNYYTIEEAKRLLTPQVLPLSSYQQGEPVEVLDPNKNWTKGFITERDPISGHLHVHTERGPVTIATTHRIRRPSEEE